jgi:hypothetical protein
MSYTFLLARAVSGKKNMNEHETLSAERGADSVQRPCSAENVSLPNDTKIRFCNAFDALRAHCILCKECDIYLRWGDGDLCSAGKTSIAIELCYADTHIELPPTPN